MPRPPRLQYPGAIYHLVTRGDGRRTLFHDDGHYARFTQGLSDEVSRSGWFVLAFCWMPNHVHALIKTPEPNLCRGMQHWLSGYANWYAKRNRRTSATLRELSERFGLSHPDSASDLIRRGAKRIEQSSEAVRQQKAIEKKLELNPESRT